MNRFRGTAAEVALLLWFSGRAIVRSVAGHWALAAFSLVAAFGTWMAIQDVENPRETGQAPGKGGGIQVQAVDVPEGCIVGELPSIRVSVEARRGDIPNLLPGDFDAEVAIGKVVCGPGETTIQRSVNLTSSKRGVDVLGVVPPEPITITLVAAARADIQVRANVTAPPPAGFEIDGDPVLDPPLVTVRGRADQVQGIKSVDLDVNLAQIRDESYTAEGAYVARSESGNVLPVTITPAKGKATFAIKQAFSQRPLVLEPQITGSPAPGFAIKSVTVDPRTVQVSGPKTIIDGLQNSLLLEPYDITGVKAGAPITATRPIQRPDNVSTSRQTAVITIEIQALDGAATLFVAPTYDSIPNGMAVDLGTVSTVQVHVSGPQAAVAALKPTDIKVSVPLSGAVLGANQVTPKVTLPSNVAGLRADPVEPVTVTLRAAGAP